MINTSTQETYFNSTLDLAKSKDKIKCHCWMKPDNTLIICTLQKVFVFKHNEIKHILDFILPENEIVTLLTDFIIDDPAMKNVVSNLMYLIDLGKPSVV
jgi:hypothetical protein